MNILILVARRYNGHELWVALGTLQSRGHTFEIASTAYEIVDEVTGQPNIIKVLIKDIASTQQYDALMVVSGNMADTEAYWTSHKVQQIVEEFHKADKPIAAICCSVPTIRLAASGKHVSYFPLLRSKDLLSRAGAILCNLSVTVDGNLVTAEHQMATQMWAQSFCDVLDGAKPKISLTEVDFEPGRRNRKPSPELQYIRSVVKKTGRRNTNDNDIPSK